jgi:hypothetical protein
MYQLLAFTPFVSQSARLRRAAGRRAPIHQLRHRPVSQSVKSV